MYSKMLAFAYSRASLGSVERAAAVADLRGADPNAGEVGRTKAKIDWTFRVANVRKKLNLLSLKELVR